MKKAKVFDFHALDDDLRKLGRTSDSSEYHCLLDFMADTVGSVAYDIKAGEPENAEVPEILRIHLLSVLDQFEDSVDHLRRYIKDRVQ